MFTEEERASLYDLGAIVTDENGQEVLIGLTAEETEEYLKVRRAVGSDSQAERERYLALHDKHEIARIEALGAKYQTHH